MADFAVFISAMVTEVTYTCFDDLQAPIAATINLESPIAKTIPAGQNSVVLYPTGDVGAGWPLLTPATPTTRYDKIKNVTYDASDPYHIGTTTQFQTTTQVFGDGTITDPVLPSNFGTATSIAIFYSCNPVAINGTTGVSGIGIRFRHRIGTGTWSSWIDDGKTFLKGGAEEAVAMSNIAFSEVITPWTGLSYSADDIKNLQVGFQSRDRVSNGWINDVTELHLMRVWAIVTYTPTDALAMSAPVTETISLTSAVEQSAPTAETLSVLATVTSTVNINAKMCW